ncbi:hypothetical protein H6G27_33350 [Nostoc linckia FACHB-104]|nr:hypothetical protein [Nostoc linckia FACHB-104]
MSHCTVIKIQDELNFGLFSKGVQVFLIISLTICYPSLVKAEICPDGDIAKASEETKTYSNQNYNFSFQIPANYRTAHLSNKSTINILDPVSYEIVLCQLRRREPTDDFPPEITVSIIPLKSRNVLDSIQKRQNIKKVLNTTTIAEQQAIIYLDTLSGLDYFNISFPHLNKKYFITITAPVNYKTISTPHGEEYVPTGVILEDVLEVIVSSFKFIN